MKSSNIGHEECACRNRHIKYRTIIEPSLYKSNWSSSVGPDLTRVPNIPNDHNIDERIGGSRTIKTILLGHLCTKRVTRNTAPKACTDLFRIRVRFRIMVRTRVRLPSVVA
jgi:hypothetical protein